MMSMYSYLRECDLLPPAYREQAIAALMRSTQILIRKTSMLTLKKQNSQTASMLRLLKR